MIGFLIRKAFFDSWDNIVRLILINIGFLLMFPLMITLPFLGDDPSLIRVFLLGLPGYFLLFLYLGFLSPMLREISDYRAPDFKDCLSLFRTNLKTILAFAVLNGVAALLLLIALPFYMRLGGPFGSFGVGLLFWSFVFWCGIAQYYLPLMARLETDPRKILKKSFLLFMDNLGFSIFLMFWSLLIAVLSIFTVFLLPGFSNVLLFHQVALKLRLYKYDYLEEQGLQGKAVIPWDTLLAEDRDNVGIRTLKGTIFPWKD